MTKTDNLKQWHAKLKECAKEYKEEKAKTAAPRRKSKAVPTGKLPAPRTPVVPRAMLTTNMVAPQKPVDRPETFKPTNVNSNNKTSSKRRIAPQQIVDTNMNSDTMVATMTPGGKIKYTKVNKDYAQKLLKDYQIKGNY